MAEEWKEVKEEKKPDDVVVPEVEEQLSDGMSAFIKETAALEKPEPEKPKVEEPPKPEVKEEIKEPPKLEPKKDDSGFIADLKNATPEEYQKRISYLYAKQKDNERLWAEARTFQKKQSEEVEKLRSEQAKERLAKTEAELDADQLKVINLLDRNSPDYNAVDGAKLLRELTRKDALLKQEREAEEKMVTEAKTAIETDDKAKAIEASKKVIDEWADTKDYAKPGHPLYSHVQGWLKKAYETAPEHITTADIVKKAGEVFDDYVAKQAKPEPKPEPKPTAPGVGEKLTVSQVIGTGQVKPGQGADAVSKLTQQQKHVAERLFWEPEKGVTKEKAYQLYADGLDV